MCRMIALRITICVDDDDVIRVLCVWQVGVGGGRFKKHTVAFYIGTIQTYYTRADLDQLDVAAA